MIQIDIDVLLMVGLMRDPRQKYRIDTVIGWFPLKRPASVKTSIKRLTDSGMLYDSRQTGIGITPLGDETLADEIHNVTKGKSAVGWVDRARSGMNADGTPSGIEWAVVPKKLSPFAVMPPDMEGMIDALRAWEADQ